MCSTRDVIVKVLESFIRDCAEPEHETCRNVIQTIRTAAREYDKTIFRLKSVSWPNDIHQCAYVVHERHHNSGQSQRVQMPKHDNNEDERNLRFPKSTVDHVLHRNQFYLPRNNQLYLTMFIICKHFCSMTMTEAFNSIKRCCRAIGTIFNFLRKFSGTTKPRFCKSSKLSNQSRCGRQ